MGEEEKKDKPKPIASATSELEKKIKELINPTKKLGGILGEIQGMLNGVQGLVHPFSQVHQAAAELARGIGLAGKSIMSTATRTVQLNRQMQLSMSYNISTPEMLKLQGTMMSKLGRNVAVDQVGTIQRNAEGQVVNPNFDSTLENLVAANTIFGADTVGNIVAGFDKLGKSMKSAAKATGKLYQEAGEYGINLQKYTENFTNNLDMAQRYNFRNGVNGLREMARKATEIRQDMGQIARFADKVGSVTGAVETAANLQVLGGSFASLSNPLAMLNESLTDINGLQNRFNQMTAGAARYNSVTHEIEMDPVTRQIMKRAAESMGVDANNFIDQAYAQARRTEIERQMTGIGNLSPEVAKLLPNVGEIDSETGAAGATIGGKFYSVAEIAGHDELQKQLVEETRSESDDIKQIAKSVLSIDEKFTGTQSQIENEAASNIIRPGVVNGLSVWDMTTDFINKKFSPSLIKAAGSIDLFRRSIGGIGTILANTVLATVGATFEDFNDPKKFKEAIQKAVTELAGTGKTATAIGEVASEVLGVVLGKGSELANEVNDYTKSTAGINMAAGFEQPNTVYGREGQPVATPKDTVTTSNARSTATSNYTASNFTGQYEKGPSSLPNFSVASTASNTGGWTGYYSTPSYQYSTDYTKQFAQPIPNYGWSANQKTLESYSVNSTSTSSTGQQNQGGTQGNRTHIESYDLNITGTLTLNINGDKGKIGAIEILELIKKDESVKRELAVMLRNAAKEAKRRR